MSKRRQRTQLPPKKPKGFNLANVHDSSGTTEPLSSRKKNKYLQQYEKVDPPFKGETGAEKPITWKDIGIMWKVALAVGSFFFAIVLPIALFASGLNSEVKTLQDDVNKITDKTAELGDNSVQYSERIKGLERSVSEIRNNIFSNKNSSNNTITPSNYIKQGKATR